MGYTRKQLIDAYCRSVNFTATPRKTNLKFIQEKLSDISSNIQSSAVSDAKSRIKNIAIAQLETENRQSSEDL